jgi:hypothetical protein
MDVLDLGGCTVGALSNMSSIDANASYALVCIVIGGGGGEEAGGGGKGGLLAETFAAAMGVMGIVG